MAIENVGKLICPNCGGEFKEHNAKCPYCGTMYYPGAEEEYLKKLEHVRTDLEDLGSVPEQETVKAIKKRAGWVIKLAVAAIIVILLCIGIVVWKTREESYDAKAQYVWRQENYPKMEELFENEQYAELYDFIEQGTADGIYLSDWEHWSFMMVWGICDKVEQCLSREADGETLQEYQETVLLNDYWILKGISYSVLLSKEDREQLEPFRAQALAGLEGRWDFSQEDVKKFEEEVKNNYGYPKYETCEAYIKKWMKGK